MYYIYLIRCVDNSIYTGITTDIKRRLDEHFSQNEKSAKYTKSKMPVSLELCFTTSSRSLASKLEYRIKRLSKNDKENLIINKDLDVYFSEILDIKEYKLVEVKYERD